MNQSVLNELLQKTKPTPINTSLILDNTSNNEIDVDDIDFKPLSRQIKQMDTIKKQTHSSIKKQNHSSIKNYNNCKIIISITIIIIIIFIINDYLMLKYTNINLL